MKQIKAKIEATLGPWQVLGKYITGPKDRQIGSAIELQGSSILKTEKLQLEAYANARLMAKAPELLQAIEGFISFVAKDDGNTEMFDWWIMELETIAKGAQE
jgi:hypothetical protein